MGYDDGNFDVYFKLYEEARELEKLNKVDEALEIYLSILKKYKPIGSAYYERAAIILEKQKEYKKAIEVCNLCINNTNIYDFNIDISKFEHRKNRLVSKIDKSNAVPKSTKSVANKSNKPQKKKSSSLVTTTPTTEAISKEIVYPDWYVSISFGTSKSDNFVQALAIAKMAPQFIENNIDGKVLYQAIYSDLSSEYLQFIKLYELVSQWKSCFVVINGQLMDRKIIGKLNYCYGDKCRSGNKDFCYGASEMTANPFGCHRLQISAGNSPWWTISTRTNRGYIIDKKTILERIKEKSEPYLRCPCFDITKTLSVVDSLPAAISYNDYEKLERDRYFSGEMKISLDGIQLNKTTTSSEASNNSIRNYQYSVTEDEKKAIKETEKKESSSFLKKLFNIFTK